MENNVKIFNSPVEVGIRALLVLAASDSNSLDLQSLVYFDYFLVHSGDVKGGPDSLHPPSPFRSGEIAVKREILKKSLQILHKKSLVGVEFGQDGIGYNATESGIKFADSLQGTYAQLLRERAVWLKSEFGNKSQAQINKFVSGHIQSWGAEFLNRG